MGSSSCRSPDCHSYHDDFCISEAHWARAGRRHLELPSGAPGRGFGQDELPSRAAWACLRSRKPEQDGHAGASTARADITVRPVSLYRPHNLRSGKLPRLERRWPKDARPTDPQPSQTRCHAALRVVPSGMLKTIPGLPTVLAAAPGQPHQPSWMYHVREAQGKHPGPRRHGRADA
jgi:hypothetical protein